MADASVKVANNAAGDRPLDAESVAGHPDGTAYRERMQVAGAVLAEVVAVKNANPSLSAYALATRPIPYRASTATTTQVPDSAADVQLLASNASRLGASISNDSSAVLYVRVGGGAATTTNYTVKVATNSHWEAPFGCTAEVRGIWASDPGDGAARITEYT